MLKCLFDYVPETGGSQVHAILVRLLPGGSVSEQLNPHENPLCLIGATGWPLLCGHFGAEYRPIIADANERVRATLVRNPLERALSIYQSFRCVPQNHPGYSLRHVELARRLTLSEFIRSQEASAFIADSQTIFLYGKAVSDPSSAARDLLDQFHCIGISDDLAEFVRSLLTKLEASAETLAADAKLLFRSQDGNLTLNAADRDFLCSINRFDLGLYDEARRRLGRSGDKNRVVIRSERRMPEEPTHSGPEIGSSLKLEDTVPRILSPAERIEMTLRCRDCDSLPKVEGAGDLVLAEDGTPTQVMHNGLRVFAGGYCGGWMIELIRRCRGHHEPQEERAFHEVLRHVSEHAVMLELGGGWSYYSLWFLLGHPRRRSLVIEPDPINLQVGITNGTLNNLTPEFHQGFADGRPPGRVHFLTERSGNLLLDRIAIPDFLEAQKVDQLDIFHCDAQGVELDIISSCSNLIEAGRVRFLVISTHAEQISGDYLTHQRCLHLIRDLGCTVLVEHDVHESFSGDGLIVAHYGEVSGWEPPPISYNHYSLSLYRNPLFDLAQIAGRNV